MTDSKIPNDGGPAFPWVNRRYEFDGPSFDYEGDPGMALRDWFAGHAMPSLLAQPTTARNDTAEDAARLVAKTAYLFADAMLQAREEAPDE